jgi:hypothetical protein
MRRLLTIVLLLAILGGIGWWLRSWFVVAAPPTDPWSAVPADAVAVLEVPKPFSAWDHFTGTSQFWGDLEGSPLFGGVNAVLGRLSESDPALGSKQHPEKPLLVFWCPVGGDSLSAVVVWPVDRSPGALLALGTALHSPMPPSLWNGEVLPVQPDSLLPPMAMAWDKGLLLLSTDRALLKAALAQAAPPTGLMAKARASFSEGADAHLLVKPALASLLLGGGGLFPQGQAVDGWTALDVRLRPGAVLMNGLLFPAGAPTGLAALGHQQPGNLEVLRALPANVCRLRAVQVDDPAAYVAAVAGKAPDPALFSAYGAWLRGSIATAEAPDAGDSSGNRWAMFTADDPGKAAAALEARCPDGGCPTADYRGATFRRLPDAGALPALFGPDLADFAQPYWTLLGNTVAMANTPAAMRAAIDAWTDRNSLALDPRSGDFFQRFGSEAVYSWWVDVAKVYPAPTGPLAEVRRSTGGLLVQLSPRPDGAFTATCCFQHAPVGKSAAGALWTTALGAPPEGPVRLVQDYLSRTQQVLVQDRDHRISLISCTGKLLWQRQLDGPLLGDVQQVDRYRNGKLQLLFNTAGKVWMIDRLGRDVEDFPVALKDSACAPLAVFDYEGKRDYRVLVPTASGALLNLGMDGKPVSGWMPQRLPAPALAAVEHARIRGKDFLVLPLRNGAAVVLDRRGDTRYAPKLRMDRIEQFLGSREAMAIGDRRLLWAHSAGAVLSGSLDGEVDTLSAAASGRIAVFDLDGDGHDEVLRATVSALTAEAAGKALFRTSYPDAPGAAAFPVPVPGDATAVGVVLPEQGQVRLYDSAGELWPGFPMDGCVPFRVADINLDGNPEVVSVDRAGVVGVHPLAPKP